MHNTCALLDAYQFEKRHERDGFVLVNRIGRRERMCMRHIQAWAGENEKQ